MVKYLLIWQDDEREQHIRQGDTRNSAFFNLKKNVANRQIITIAKCQTNMKRTLKCLSIFSTLLFCCNKY